MHFPFLLQMSGRQSVHLWDVLFDEVGRISSQSLAVIKTEIWFMSLLAAGLFLLIAVLISNAIAYEPGKNPTDARKRKIALYATGFVLVLLLFLIGFFATIDLTGRQADEFRTTMLTATAVSAVVYLGLAFALSKIFPRKKVGTWF